MIPAVARWLLITREAVNGKAVAVASSVGIGYHRGVGVAAFLLLRCSITIASG
jgi:hypothetical protein